MGLLLLYLGKVSLQLVKESRSIFSRSPISEAPVWLQVPVPKMLEEAKIGRTTPLTYMEKERPEDHGIDIHARQNSLLL